MENELEMYNREARVEIMRNGMLILTLTRWASFRESSPIFHRMQVAHNMRVMKDLTQRGIPVY